MKKTYTLLLFALCYAGIIAAQCNGYTELCSKKYNEITTVMTHNAFNNEADDFSLPNQTHGIAQQLNDGVRGLMIDVYDIDGVISVYHSFEILGTEPLSEDLGEIKDFLDNNPNEVISIIFESHVTALDIENELANAGLTNYLYHQTLGEEWPTLQEMINADQRLVIFSESNDGSAFQTWYHYAWDYVFDTNYSYSSPSNFDCGVNRGDVSNGLYLVNHWISSSIGTGDKDEASIVNANPLLIDRLQECQNENNRQPNFIGVDFYEVGDAFEAAAILNGITTTSSEDISEKKPRVSIYPNPSSTFLEITTTETEAKSFHLLDMWGREITEEKIENGNLSIPCQAFAGGVYIYVIKNQNGKIFDEGKVTILPR